ncbi:hypothetical protein [Citricoccus sp. SGAir0253]|nr:hypothetical protein [Citricoccus sp. SGAir0253]
MTVVDAAAVLPDVRRFAGLVRLGGWAALASVVLIVGGGGGSSPPP